jgi:DNA-binding NarL/FixJ family response regulator
MTRPTRELNRVEEREPMRVFIVDDSDVVRERLVAMLCDLADIELVGQAKDAFSAIEGIHHLAPHVVILDIHMPGSPTGMYVLEKVLGERNPPVVIMLTNYSYIQYKKRCIDGGASFFFDKSTEFEKLPEVLKALVPTLTRPDPASAY